MEVVKDVEGNNTLSDYEKDKVDYVWLHNVIDPVQIFAIIGGWLNNQIMDDKAFEEYINKLVSIPGNQEKILNPIDLDGKPIKFFPSTRYFSYEFIDYIMPIDQNFPKRPYILEKERIEKVRRTLIRLHPKYFKVNNSVFGPDGKRYS